MLLLAALAPMAAAVLAPMREWLGRCFYVRRIPVALASLRDGIDSFEECARQDGLTVGYGRGSRWPELVDRPARNPEQ